jgi:signal transduction histidine kinase
LVGLAIGLPVAVRRRWPLTVAGVVLGVAVAALSTGIVPTYAGAGPSAALACALYLVGVAVAGRPSMIALAVCLAVLATALVVAPAATPGSLNAAAAALASLLVGVAWVVGRAARERRGYAARTAEQRTERAVGEERLRIARELHDIVAHSMSLIAVKAAVANHVADERPQETRDALRVIETTSRDALTEIRRALGVLRTEAAFSPTPGLSDLPGLVAPAAGAGVRVDLALTPEGARVPDGVGLAVYRIVQEALTNVVKHAAPASCRTTVAVEPGQVRVEVTDDGTRAATSTGGGQGIIGMRERVAIYGGDFAAGPRRQGGFTVTARLPFEST